MSRKTRRFSMEGLERREMMAGDVSVDVNNGVLYITGDGQANDIEVVAASSMDNQGKDWGFVSVRGRDGTTIEGPDGPNVGASQFTRVEIDLGGGNDVVELRHGYNSPVMDENVIRFDIDIDTGSGRDDVQVHDFYSNADLSINTGSYVGDVSVEDSTMNSLTIDANTSNSTNYVEIDNVTADTLVANRFDSMELTDSTVDVTAQLFGRWASSITVDGFDGDNLYVRGKNVLLDDVTTTNDVSVWHDPAYSMNANFEIRHSDIGRDLDVDTYAGNDVIDIWDVEVGDDLEVRTRDGRDTVRLDDVDAGDRLLAQLGTGNDTMEARFSSARRAWLDGGRDKGDKDSLELMLNSFTASHVYRNWEKLDRWGGGN